MSLYKIEVCVDSFKGAKKAHKQGAHQIELCGHLELDGLTPHATLLKKVLSNLDIYTKVMVRPRAGDFTYTDEEKVLILKQTQNFKDLDIEEIVFGAILEDRLDIEFISQVAAIAYPMKLTIHKAIDVSKHALEDIEQLKKIENIEAILSSGQKPTAKEGISNLLNMKKACGDKIKLIAAGKILPGNLEYLHNTLQLKYYHGRNIL